MVKTRRSKRTPALASSNNTLSSFLAPKKRKTDSGKNIKEETLASSSSSSPARAKPAQTKKKEAVPVVVEEKDKAVEKCYENLKKQESKDKSDESIPRAIFHTVHYEPRGVTEDTLQTQFGTSPRQVFNRNPNNKKVFAFVSNTYVIPQDFDKICGKYGPRSGLCHEERVIRAYESKLLKLKPTSAREFVKMCTECGEKGHLGSDCPTLLEGL